MNPMSASLRFLLAAGALVASSLVPTALRAQVSPTTKSSAPDSLAFPRQFVKWIFTTQGDSAFAHAGPVLRESMKSADDVNAMAGRVASRFGEAQGTDAEVQFDEGALKVYIAVMRYEKAPEPAAWIVAYSPSTHVVERSSFGPLSRVKEKYPQAKLP
jgi:hypothetical protein